MGDHDHNWAKFALLPDRSEPVGTGSEPDSVPEPGSVPEPKSKPKIDNKRGFLREDMIAATTALQVSIDEIRNSQTNWESKLLSQGVIQRDVDFIRQLRKDVDLPDRNPGLCGDVFVNLLNNTTIDESTMQYVLFQLDDVISNNRDRVKIFHNGLCGSIYPQLLKMLNHRDPLIQHMAATIIAKLACWHRDPMEKNHLRTYLSWLMNQLKLDDMNYNQSVIRCLQMMLRIDEYRFEFLSFDGINTILIILASGVNFQNWVGHIPVARHLRFHKAVFQSKLPMDYPGYKIQYQLIYCLWVLTFNPLLAESMPENGIPILANILTETRKEKVTRIVLAVFRNLIEKPKDPQISKENSISMVHCKVLTQLSMLEQKRSNDEDIMNDVEFLTEILLNSVQCLSSFDEYATEVKSGNLNWSPMHKSAKFWLENAARLNEPGQGLLKKLVSLLQPGNDPVVLAVACHDIGEYVRHYPRGKQFVEDIGCKEPMMFLLNHDDPNVRNEALLAIQKLMVQNWTVLIKLIEKEQMEEKAEGRHKRRG